ARVQSVQTYTDTLRALLQATRADPADRDAAKRAARATIDAGRDAGDSRMVGAALGILRPFLSDADSETLYLAATARQYQHDFSGALKLLDQALQMDPGDVNSRLSRATIQTVLGRYDLAKPDCLALQAIGPVALLCQATALLMTAQAPAVAKRLGLMVAHPELMDAAFQPWALGLLAELSQLNNDNATARDYLHQVLELDPKSIRDRLILADLMLQDGLANQVAQLLKDAPPTDSVLIRRVLAAEALNTDSTADRAELAKRMQLNLDPGLTAHAREEARYFLQIVDDPAIALERAEVNWALQHEYEDARLLIDAAVAAGRPAAAKPVLDWAQQQGVTAPALQLDALVKRLAP
ncbi:MAG: hypothetical protein H7317_01920, partial [Pseudorhodobacter sp.]|nr:hypothetical protein [Pseudorhodobacter sp.]